MVELKHHPGIVELPWRYKWKKRVMINQPHGIPEPGISSQRRDVIIRLSMEISGVESDIPRQRCHLIRATVG